MMMPPSLKHILLLVVCSFFHFPLTGESAQDSYIENHFVRGYELSESKEFSDALLEFNLAMRYMRHLPNHPRRKELEDLIQRTKERMVVQRYMQKSPTSSSSTDDNLLPLKFEPNDFQVLQTYGKVYVKKVWKDRLSIEAKEYLGEGRQVTCIPGGAIELIESRGAGYRLRCVDGAGFTLVSSDTIELQSGSFSVFAQRPLKSLFLGTNSTKVEVSTKQAFALFIEVGFSGDLSTTSMLGRIQIKTGDESTVLLPGKRFRAFEGTLSELNDLELGSHYIKSKLIGSFSTPPIFYPQLVQQARIQLRQLSSP